MTCDTECVKQRDDGKFLICKRFCINISHGNDTFGCGLGTDNIREVVYK